MKMYFLKLLKKRRKKKSKFIHPIYDSFQDIIFKDIFQLDKFINQDIELPCNCAYIENNYIIIQNYFF